MSRVLMDFFKHRPGINNVIHMPDRQLGIQRPISKTILKILKASNKVQAGQEQWRILSTARGYGRDVNNLWKNAAWGMTCYEFMHSFANKSKLSDINVVPLIVGTTRVSSEYQLNEMVRMFAEKLQGSPSFMYAPAIAASTSDRELG